MRNEDSADLAAPDLVFHHLHLSTFAAIDQVAFLLRLQKLCSRIPAKCWNCGIIA